MYKIVLTGGHILIVLINIMLLVFLLKRIRTVDTPKIFYYYFLCFLINEIFYIAFDQILYHKIVLVPAFLMGFWLNHYVYVYTILALIFSTLCFSILNNKKHILSFIFIALYFISRVFDTLFFNKVYLNYIILLFYLIHIYNSIYTFYLLADDAGLVKKINKARYYFALAVFACTIPGLVLGFFRFAYSNTYNLFSIIFLIVFQLTILPMNYLFYKAIKHYK